MSEPEHVTLAREAWEAWEAGLVVTHLMPAPYGGRYNVELRQPDGALWDDCRNQSAAMIRAHIAHWPAHRQARTGLRLVGTGLVLNCGCLTDTDTDTTKEK